MSVTARENTQAVQGSITLTFADTAAAWSSAMGGVDAQGARTTLVVNDMRQWPISPLASS